MARIKHRYILVEFVFSKVKAVYSINVHSLFAEIKQVVEYVHGKRGVSGILLGLNLKYINEYTKLALIRVRRDHHQDLLSSLPFIKQISARIQNSDSSKYVNKPIQCFLKVIKVTGTIRSAQKFIIKRNETMKRVLLSQCTTDEEKQKLKLKFSENDNQNDPSQLKTDTDEDSEEDDQESDAVKDIPKENLLTFE